MFHWIQMLMMVWLLQPPLLIQQLKRRMKVQMLQFHFPSQQLRRWMQSCLPGFPFPNQWSVRRNRNQLLSFLFPSLWSRKRIRNQPLPFPFPNQQSRRKRNQLLRPPIHGQQLWRTTPNIHNHRMLTVGRGRQKSWNYPKKLQWRTWPQRLLRRDLWSYHQDKL